MLPLPLALYVHVPWCQRKCPYCDFNSHQLTGELPEDQFIAALLADLRLDLEQIAGRSLSSIFIGGGTPSLLAPASIESLLVGVSDLVELAIGCEITLEANPGTVECSRLAGYRGAGINRLSLGVQSFNDRLLYDIGRIHSGAEARAAIDAAVAAGFDELNLDLMYGLPEQSEAEALLDLVTAIEYAPSHISYYQLTLEPDTPFYNQPPPLPDEELSWSMQRAGHHQLVAAGYGHYEISAFSQPEHQCRHNLNYWQFGDYLGIGPGAHGKLTLTTGEVIRSERVASPQAYLAASQFGDRLLATRRLSADDLRFEFMLNALRLRAGVSRQLFTQTTGLEYDAIEAEVEAAVTRGWLQRSERIEPTELGRRFLNDLLTLFLGDRPEKE